MAERESKKETKSVEGAKVYTEMQGNIVYIGKKGVMAYVLAVITQFSENKNEVLIKARGKSISRAVDVAEIVRNKAPDLKIVSITTSTEDVTSEDGRALKVSAIEIKLRKE
jgi:DNA-binding protein